MLAENGTVSDILPSEHDNDEKHATKINLKAIIGLTIAIIGGLIIIGPEKVVKYIKNLLSVPAENPSVSSKSISGILADKLREYGNDINKPYDRVTIENIIDDYRRGEIPFDSIAGEIVRELEENSAFGVEYSISWVSAETFLYDYIIPGCLYGVLSCTLR